MSRTRSHRFHPALAGFPLEPRIVLAGKVAAAAVGGVLTINGTEKNDRMVVNLRPAGRGPKAAGWAAAVIQVPGARPVRVARLQGLVINLGDGDDRLVINDRGRVGVPASIDGGSGNDTILGGSGPETILGGDGDDVIWGRRGANQVDGGAGRDQVDGQTEPAVSAAPSPTPATVTTPAPAPFQLRPSPTTPTPTVPPVASVPSAPAPAPAPDVALVAELVELVNRDRAAQGLGRVSVSATLHDAATLHARAMAQLDRMEHELPGAAYPTLLGRAQAVGYSFARLGENIAFNFPSAAAVHYAWMNSDGHRANILNRDFTEIGIAVARNARGELYYCQVFGRPA